MSLVRLEMVSVDAAWTANSGLDKAVDFEEMIVPEIAGTRIFTAPLLWIDSFLNSYMPQLNTEQRMKAQPYAPIQHMFLESHFAPFYK